MNTILFNAIAMFINQDTIAKYTRALVASGFSALLAWKGGFLLPFLTPEMQTIVTAAVVGLAVGAWSQISSHVSAPTTVQTEKVVAVAVDKGVLTPAKAEEVKIAVVDDSIK